MWRAIAGLFFALVTSTAFGQDAINTEELRGVWLAEGMPVVEFFESFNPNRGVALVYDDDGKPISLDQWRLDGETIDVGFLSYALDSTTQKLHIFRFSQQIGVAVRAPSGDMQTSLSIKTQPEAFAQELQEWFWNDPLGSSYTRFVAGFSTRSGVLLSRDNEGNLESSVRSWSIANDVVRIGSETYPDARISGDVLILLDSSDEIAVFRRGTSSNSSRVAMEDDQDSFMKSLLSGRWVISVLMEESWGEFRPVFGDLSGVVFNYANGRLRSTEKWEYSKASGSLRRGYREYSSAVVVGDVLILNDKEGEPSGFARPKGEIGKSFVFADTQVVSVSEQSSEEVVHALKGQWHFGDHTYLFEFDPSDNRRGYMHEFRSEPLLISSNSIRVSLPGMPTGVPGMGGPNLGPYDVFAIKKDGTASVFAKE